MQHATAANKAHRPNQLQLYCHSKKKQPKYSDLFFLFFFFLHSYKDCVVSVVLLESMGLIEKPTIIPLLQTLLNESSNEPKEREDLSLCNYILLKEKTKEQIKEFKLFEESNVPMFSQNMTNINLNEPGYDNDDETDNEQIRNGSKIIHDAISDALSLNA